MISAYDTSSRFKITKNPAERPRIKTEADDLVNTKKPFQNMLPYKRDKERNKSADKNKTFLENKNLP